MKTFRWMTLTGFSNGDHITLMDVTNEKDGLVITCREIIPYKSKYRPVVTYRGGMETTIETLSMKEAMEAVEIRLMKYGVIQEGDEVEDCVSEEE